MIRGNLSQRIGYQRYLVRFYVKNKINKFLFLGVAFDAGERAYMVRITSGNRAPLAPARDVVMMDDFIYSEPKAQ